MGIRRGEPCALTAPAAVEQPGDRGTRDRSGGDRGMVTAELAVALPAVVLVALVALSGLEVVMTQMRCRDAAGIAARLAARGESPATVSDSVAASAPGDVRVAVRREGELVAADVTTDVTLLGLGRLLPAFTVSATAFSVAELPVPP